MFPKGFPSKNDFYDVMHISIPYLFSRDIFLTRNWHDFRADKLQEKFSDLLILTPQQLIIVLLMLWASSKVQPRANMLTSSCLG